jgi:uncharacterized protein (TIGR02246 family)
MSKSLILLLGLGLMLTTACQPMVDVETEKAQVEVVLDTYVQSVETENMELYAENVTHDPKMVNFGGFGDPIVGWEALQKVMEGQNEALSETKITVSDLAIHVSPTGQLAWATCLWDLKAMMGESPVQLPVRCTWVLEKQEGRWIIVHFHKSMAATG